MPEALEVFLSILGILAIVIAGAFVIVFIVDLLISIIDSKNGIFFKRSKEVSKTKEEFDNKIVEEKETFYSTKEQPTIITSDKENVVPYTGVDLKAAEKEKLELLKMKEEEEAYRSKLTKTSVLVDATPEVVESEQEDWNFDFDTHEEQGEVRTKDEQIADILEEYEDILEKKKEINEQEEAVFDFSFANEQSNDTLSIVTDNISDKNEEIAVVEQNLKLAESENAKQEALAQLDELLNDKERLVKFAQDAKETLDFMEKERELAEEKLIEKDSEIEHLKAELALSREQKAVAITKYIKTDTNGATKEELEQRLVVLEDRLKSNEKELKKVKKEYRPLEIVRTSLESNRKKLDRKAAIVARQNTLLYGVNNYVDLDDEKARKLIEENELLDGLRMSVRQCEEIIENSKERYPALEQSYKILTKNNKELRDDINAIKEDLVDFDKKNNDKE